METGAHVDFHIERNYSIINTKITKYNVIILTIKYDTKLTINMFRNERDRQNKIIDLLIRTYSFIINT